MKKTGSEKRLNIISLDIPYPPDYGGAIDIFHKLIALNKMGIKIYLHCFYYNRVPSKELEKLCFKIYYYPRNMNYFNILSWRPYMIQSRLSSELLINLNQNTHPILFEGLHTCYEIANPKLKERIKIVRMHNIEYQYYYGLSKFTNNPLKKLYYQIESRKLHNFDKILSHADLLCPISGNDYKYYSKVHDNVMNLPAFHGNHALHSKNRGKYAFYHGNLNVLENEYAALYLINQIFNNLDYSLIIAGRNPGKKLIRVVELNPNVSLINNINGEELSELIANASMHILPGFQSAGMKLKLIHVLNSEGHIITNSKMITDKKFVQFCNIADSIEDMKKMILEKAEQPLEKNEILKRQKMIAKNYSNKQNIEILVNRIFN